MTISDKPKNIRQLHWISGLTISLFFLVHIFNHLAALGGVEAHLAYMDAARKIYRNPVVEAILLLAVVMQIVSGIALVRKLRKVKKQAFEKLRVYSGLYLAFFLLAHTTAIVLFRSNGVNTNFYFGVLGFVLFPANLIFIPYYSLGVWSVFAHLSATHYCKIQQFIPERRARLHAWVIIIGGAIVTLAIVWAFISAVEGRTIPEEYMKLAQ